MRTVPYIVLALSAAGLIASAAPVHARALRVSRQPDVTLDLCAAGAKCAPVAVGDFDGDGTDDAAFQQNTGTQRQLHVVFGPFGASPQPTVHLTFAPLEPGENGLLATDVADMDGDGQDELLVGDVTIPASGAVERQSIFVINFDVLAAISKRRPLLDDDYFFGRVKPTFLWRRDVPLKEAGGPRGIPRLEVRGADVNGDGVRDLVLGIDRTANVALNARAGGAIGRVAGGKSEVVVQFLKDGDLRPTPAELADTAGYLHWPLRPIESPAGAASVRITGLGTCERGGLAGVADVTGDRMADIVVRRCEGGGLPDQLGLVEGRPAWPATVKVAGAIEPATPPDLPPAPGRPGTPPEPPGGGGYIQIDPRGPAMNIFDALPTFFTEDLNGDGVLDIGFGLADKTHVWLGGRDLGMRLVEDRSDRIFLGAGLGGSMANRTWRPTDLNGDGRRDLALTQLRTLATAKVDAAGNATFESSASEPIHVFARDRAADDVIDVSSDPADDIWSDARYTLWAFGDFNGDHVDDVMLGSPAASIDSEYPVIYGPFIRR